MGLWPYGGHANDKLKTYVIVVEYARFSTRLLLGRLQFFKCFNTLLDRLRYTRTAISQERRKCYLMNIHRSQSGLQLEMYGGPAYLNSSFFFVFWLLDVESASDSSSVIRLRWTALAGLDGFAFVSTTTV